MVGLGMKLKLYHARIQTLLASRNSYLSLCCGSLLLNFLLVTLCFHLDNQERTIIAPPIIEQSYWLKGDAASPSYISAMIKLMVSLRLDVSPDNVDSQFLDLSRLIAPRYANAFKAALTEEADKIKNEHLSFVFYPKGALEINRTESKVRLSGDLIAFVGTTALPATSLTYDIHYQLQNGLFLVTDWSEVKAHG
jgi:conjugal transfer pilus assembly protein TraE